MGWTGYLKNETGEMLFLASQSLDWGSWRPVAADSAPPSSAPPSAPASSSPPSSSGTPSAINP